MRNRVARESLRRELCTGRLWWTLLAGKRLAIVSGQAEALAARLIDPEFVRATGGAEVTWSVVTALACPPVSEPKRTHWPGMRNELFATEWDLLLCSAGSLSAIFCVHAQQTGRKALDIGALDRRLSSPERPLGTRASNSSFG